MPIEDRAIYYQSRAFSSKFDEPGIEEQYPPDLELEPIHIEINLHFNIAEGTAAGNVTNTVKARRNGPMILKLDAVDFENVNVLDPDGNELGWHYDGRKLTITWSRPFTANEERRVTVDYQVVHPVDGLYFSQPDEAYPDQPWYVISDHETERARHWLPCIDLPNVRTSLDFFLSAESRFTILANGTLLDEVDNGDGTKTAHWELKQLCPSYLICIAIGDFSNADDGSFDNDGNPIPVAYFCSPEHNAEDLLRTFGRTKPMMEWMTQKLQMPFPYPKYYQIAVPRKRGAMENISLVSWGENWCLQDELLSSELKWRVDQVNVHEMAHSYFGDAIVCRDFAHAWLKESWATFIEQLWREDNYSKDEADYVYYQNLMDYFQEADKSYKRPIVTRGYKSSWDLYDKHLYEGGACRLHTLRNELGDEVFWTAVQDYLQRYNGQVVETDHFRHVMEEHSGRSLGKFFDQWFFTVGYPDLNATFTYDDKRNQGNFKITQKQVDPKASIPAFVLNVELGWFIDGNEYLLPITIDREEQFITVSMTAKPDYIRFDPNQKSLHKLSFNPGDPMLRRQLTAAKDVIGRIQAAEELARTSRQANIQAIVDAYSNESFWGVRREYARILGEANHETALVGLAKIISNEQDPMVMASVFDAAKKYRDNRIQDAIQIRLKDDLPYISRQIAYEALGAQRQEAPWEMLAEASQKESFNGIIQSGAFNGLAATRQAAAIDILLDKAKYGATPNNARPTAVLALAEIGKGQEKVVRERIIEKLIDLLRDPWPYVSLYAAYGLKEMGALEAIEPLEGYGRSRSHQVKTTIQRLITSIREKDKTDGSALKKDVEDLQKKVRDLEDWLQKLAAKVESEEVI